MVSLIDNLLFFIFATEFKMFISLKKFILFKACEIVITMKDRKKAWETYPQYNIC